MHPRERNCCEPYLVIFASKNCKHNKITFLIRLGEAKDDLVVRETGRNRQMVSQILSSTFQSKGGGIKCSGPEKVNKVRRNLSGVLMSLKVQ